jgi:hypothetical protein
LTPTTVLDQPGLWFCSCFVAKQISRNSKKKSRQKCCSTSWISLTPVVNPVIRKDNAAF